MRTLLSVILLSFSQFLFACVSVTRVNSQEQFEKAIERINNGERMNLVLCKGRYVLRQSFVAKAPLKIKGKNATITCATEPLTPQNQIKETATHFVYKLDNQLSLFPMFYDNKGELIPVSESVVDSVGVNYVEGEIVAPNEFSTGTSLKIPISSNLVHLKNKNFSFAFGFFDSGWDVVNFKLECSDERYFYVTTMNNCSTKNYQYDEKAYKKQIRYVIFNAELKPNAIYYNAEYLYVPKSVNGINVLNCSDAHHKMPTIETLFDVELNGVRFEGFTGIKIQSKKDNICEIRNCHFSKCLGNAITLEKENGSDVNVANICGCTFLDCSIYNGFIVYLSSTFEKCKCINMSDCLVSRYPDANVFYKNTRGMVYVSADATLSNNVVYNTCRDHFFLWKGTIVAKGNVIFNTDEYNVHLQRNFSSDWGLVYCNHIFKDTQKALANAFHEILLEKNLLCGAFAYGNDARGIFIDDGRGDVECRDNIVLNTQIYSIDSRNSKMTEASSARNFFSGNLVTSRYRLAAGAAVKGDNLPTTRANQILTEEKNVTANVRTLEEDVRLTINSECSCHDGKIFVKKDLYREMKRSPAWWSMKRYVRVL